jgi:copper transport protein
VDLDALAIALRIAALVAVFQAAGGAMFLWVIARNVESARPDIRRLALTSALLGLALTLAHQGVEVARLGGDLSAIADPDLEALAWHSPGGIVHAAQIFGLGVIAATVSRTKRAAPSVAALAGLFTAAALAGAGHTSVHPWHRLLTPLLIAHVCVAAFWFGSLGPLLLVARQLPGKAASAVLQRFSGVAGPAVAVLGIAGGGMAVALVPTVASIQRPYGVLLACKLGGFCLLLGLAAWNRWRGTPALRLGSAGARTQLTLTICLELCLIIAVLTATAVLTTRYGPED